MSEKDVPFPYQPLIEGIEKFITDRKDCQKHQDSFLACHLEIRIIIPHNNTKRKIAHHYETYKEPYRSFLEEKQTGNISYCIPIDEQCLYIPWNINFFKNYLLSHKSQRCVHRHIGLSFGSVYQKYSTAALCRSHIPSPSSLYSCLLYQNR